ncbi:MAG: hypothetical protein EA376_13975 [Phycisphaeraceae bacterium]|nr:MAG: hypothetical protein EA376_13975 [Phycisphaeraceae bacterium]
MPASRSRTEHWRRSLEQIKERNGALEITLPRYFADGKPEGSEDDSIGQNLIWRVRIIGLSETEIHVEQPSTLGQTIALEEGIDLIGVLAIGQNRWMFETRNLGRARARLNAEKDIVVLRLQMPTHVERCQRRSFYRISTVGLVLPKVECWSVLDQNSLGAAEASNQTRITMLEDEQVVGRINNGHAEGMLAPEVGPGFMARLVNIGGGGLGLVVDPSNAKGLEARKLYWLAVDLRPQIPAPLGVAARLAHTHIDSEQRVYAGFAFEFSHNPGHKRFVVDRICKYVTLLQREQLRRRAEAER